MLLRANAGNLLVATQVDPPATYNVQFDFSIERISFGATFQDESFGWAGAFQVFDSVTGQGSMAYGWTGVVESPSNLVEVLTLIAASGTRRSAAKATFSQPPANDALPQPIAALEYVRNFISQTPSDTCPHYLRQPIWPNPRQSHICANKLAYFVAVNSQQIAA